MAKKKQIKVAFPQELEVWYVLPAIRKKLALALINEGMSQKEVAELMHTSEATISHYKKDKRAKENIIGNDLDVELKKSVTKIMRQNNLLFSEIVRLNDYLKDKGIICKIYKRKKEIIEQLPCCHCQKDSKFCCK